MLIKKYVTGTYKIPNSGKMEPEFRIVASLPIVKVLPSIVVLEKVRYLFFWLNKVFWL